LTATFVLETFLREAAVGTFSGSGSTMASILK
jgi:hypothetical protein